MHIITLTQTLNHGLLLKKVHRIMCTWTSAQEQHSLGKNNGKCGKTQIYQDSDDWKKAI